jgi:hypothetical protein
VFGLSPILDLPCLSEWVGRPNGGFNSSRFDEVEIFLAAIGPDAGQVVGLEFTDAGAEERSALSASPVLGATIGHSLTRDEMQTTMKFEGA